VPKGRAITKKKQLEKIVKEAVVAYFNVLSLHKYEIADKIRINLNLSCSIFETRNSAIQFNDASQPTRHSF